MAKLKAQTGMINWEAELAAQAEVAAGMEASTGTGQFFSLQSAQLSFAGSPIANNQMAVVILDALMENVYYEGEYDAANPQGPKCFAFGRNEAEMAPHQVVLDGGCQQNEACGGCPMNEWASAAKGKGKACRNTRRLAMIPAGELDQNGRFDPIKDVATFENAGIAYLRLPVTSVKGWAAYVKQLAGALKRPPHGVITKIQVVPDAKTQIKVVFSAIGNVPDALMGAIIKRHKEANASIAFPYQAYEAPVAAPKKAPARGPLARPAAPRGPVARPGAARTPAKPVGRKY